MPYGTAWADGSPPAGDGDGTLRVWDPLKRKQIGMAKKARKGGVYSVAVVVLERKTVVISAGKEKKIKLWNLKAGSPTS
ncbi:hypothetical protein SAMN05421505_104110 [Sinosporangium album]|uniref:Uncharacterized protein n=1 Tax=Sinosporangium album TaxID=504805 RepID=A0A1G7U7R1_9ACTN|nr:hypothetical protein [Sinosporangium album]SDG42780.1 hypothetical protein SAMN05421505_104110 [Sinosporangium album]